MNVDSILDDPNLLVLDVRTMGEWNSGHLPGAKHLPLSQLNRATQLIGAPDRPVAVYCLSGARSGSAVRVLRRGGFTRVINGGGIRALAARLGITRLE